MTSLSTLCYIEKDGQYLMLHRTVKKNDVNKDKWIGVGGHFEADESPEECVLREVKEETGYTLTSYRFRGIVTFVSGNGVTEYMHLFTADEFEGKSIACDEGELEWVKKEDVLKLNIWEGDRIFLRLLADEEPFFSLKLVYDGHDTLVSAVLNGEPMELFDILNPDGSTVKEVCMRQCICGLCVRMRRVVMTFFYRSAARQKIPIQAAMIYPPQDMWTPEMRSLSQPFAS